MISDVDAWLGMRMEGVPADFRPWLEGGDAARPTSDDSAGGDEGEQRERARTGDADPGRIAADLTRRGLGALSEAVARPGRNREAAFRLLAADAYLTYACEAILEGPEPEEALRKLIRRIAETE